MVISCSAYNCTNRWSKESDLTFHRFPLQKQDLLKLWVTATKRKGFTPTRGSFLCSNHFREEDYLVRPGTSRRHLKPEAVPSQFSFPTHLMPMEKKPRRHIRIITEDTNEETNDHIEQTKNFELLLCDEELQQIGLKKYTLAKSDQFIVDGEVETF